MEKSIQIWNWYWWSHRYALTILLASVVLAQLLTPLILNSSWAGAEATSGVILVFSVLASTFISISVFSSGGNLDLTSGQSSFPRWLTLLPVSSQKLATIPVVGMIGTLAWSWIPFALAMRILFPSLTVFNFVILPWVFLGSVATWIQAISWCPYRSGWHRLAALGLLVVTYTFLFLIGELIADWFQSSVIIVMFICGIVAAFLGLNRARLQEASVVQAETAVVGEPLKTAAYPIELSGKFELRTPYASLFWRDWHQIARIVVGISGIISLGVLTLVLFGQTSSRMMLLFPMVPTLLMATTGINFGKDAYFKPQSALPVYLGALPVSNRDYLLARLKICVVTSVMVWLIALLPVVVWLFISGNLDELKALASQMQSTLGLSIGQEWRFAVVYCTFSIFTAIVCPFPAMALGLCGRPKIETIVITVLGTCGFGLVLLGLYGFVNWTDGMKGPEGMAKIQQWLSYLIPKLLIGLLVVKLLFAGVAFQLVRRRGIEDSFAFGKRLLGLVVVGLAVVLFFFVITPGSLQPKLNLLMIAVWLFPVGSIFMAEFALDWNRHR